MKVFLGLTNIASQFQDLAYGFQENDCEIITVVDKQIQSPIVHDFWDINLSSKYREWIQYVRPRRFRSATYNRFGDLRRKTFQNCIKDCDVFFFTWNTFYHSFEDLPAIKKAGKKIVVMFVGSDIRWPFAMEQEFQSYGLHPIEYDPNQAPFQSIEYLESRLSYQRAMEKHADLIISSKDASQLALRPYLWTSGFIDLRSIHANPTQKPIPRIIHSPSNRAGKGTRYVLDAVKRLESTSLKFNFEFIENKPYHDALQLYSETDVLLGQLLCPGGGKQEREALAAGMVTCSSNPPDYLKERTSQSPHVHVTPSTVFDVMAKLIPNLKSRKKLALSGIEYANAKLDVIKFCKRILKFLKNPDDELLTLPRFYRNDLKVEEASQVDILNKYNQKVKNCSWYKKFVPTGNRDGLIF